MFLRAVGLAQGVRAFLGYRNFDARRYVALGKISGPLFHL